MIIITFNIPLVKFEISPTPENKQKKHPIRFPLPIFMHFPSETCVLLCALLEFFPRILPLSHLSPLSLFPAEKISRFPDPYLSRIKQIIRKIYMDIFHPSHIAFHFWPPFTLFFDTFNCQKPVPPPLHPPFSIFFIATLILIFSCFSFLFSTFYLRIKNKI